MARVILTSLEASEYLKLPEQSLKHDRSAGRFGIPFYKVGQRVFYDRDELDAWLDGCRKVPHVEKKKEEVRKGRATKREEVEARGLGITVPALRARRAGGGV